jgi:TonB family protein
LLIVPIAAGEEVVGILEVFSPLAGNFEGGDILLLGSVAEVAAEIYGAQQRKPSAAQPIPFLVSERVEQVLEGTAIHREEPSQETPAVDAPHNSCEPITDDAIEASRETRSETPGTGRSVSPPQETSADDENANPESRWKPRNYLLLMAGLTVLGIGTGDIVDWHMTSRLARSSAQPTPVMKVQNIASAATSAPRLPEHDNAPVSSAAELGPESRNGPAPLPLKKASGAELENSSLALKRTTQGATSHSLIADRPSKALLIPSKAVPLAGSVPNLDPRTTAQLTPAKLLHHVDPVTPDFAKEAGIDGTVLLSAVIGTDGKLKDVKFVSGDRALAIEAFRAVRDWRYRPYMLNGRPIEAETRIVMNFHP